MTESSNTSGANDISSDAVHHPSYISHRFYALLEKCGLLHIRFHAPAAAYLPKLGFGRRKIQVWLGSVDISTTANIYAHVDLDIGGEMHF